MLMKSTNGSAALTDLKKGGRRFWNNNPCTGQWHDFKEQMEWLLDVESYLNVIFTKELFCNKTALEIGCGQGIETYMAKLAGARQVFAMDISDGSVRTAKNNLKSGDVTGVDFLVGDAERLPVASNSVDLAYSIGVLHHTPDTNKTLAELHRVLRPGGKALIMLYAKNNPKGVAVRLCRAFSSLIDKAVGQEYVLYQWLSRRGAGTGDDPQGTGLLELFGCPVLKMYSKSEIEQLFSCFAIENLKLYEPGFYRLKDFLPFGGDKNGLVAKILAGIDKIMAPFGFYWVVEVEKK